MSDALRVCIRALSTHTIRARGLCAGPGSRPRTSRRRRTSLASFVSVLTASFLLAGNVYAQSPVTTVSATDEVFENRVEVSWSGSIAASSVIRIERDAEAIGVVASDVRIFEDPTADPRVSYEYCVIVTASDGTDSTPVCDNGARGFFAPTGMTASDRLFEGHVLLTWTDRSQRETSYRIIRRLASATQFTGLATVPANQSSYVDTTAIVGEEYRYGVAAFDENGFRSIFAFDNGERAAVTPPADVTASDGQFPNYVHITWVDQSPSEDGFVIYRNSVNIATVAANATMYDDAGATTGVNYTYCVASLVGGVESVQICDEGMRGGLRAPSNVVATVDTFDDRVAITWNDDADTEDGFEVYRRLLSSPDSVLLTTRPANATSFDDPTALQGLDYRFCVRAFSMADPAATSYSSAVCDAGRRSNVLPPQDVAASDGQFEDRVEVSWSNPSTTVTLFKVYRNGTLIQTLPPEVTAYDDEAIASDTDYTYEVSAVTVVATSADLQQTIEEEIAMVFERASYEETQRQIAVAQQIAFEPTAEEIEAAAEEVYAQIVHLVESYTVDASIQASVAGTIVESARVPDVGSRSLNVPGSVEATFDEFEDRVEVTWVDNSGVEKGYRVFRQAANAAVELVGEVSASRASLGDYAGVPGVTYTYHVRAFDDRGPGGESKAGSNTGRRTLEAPTGLRAADGTSESEISLTWTDNSRAETGYRVQRSDGKLDTLLAPQSNRFVDTTDLVIGKSYEYTVLATDAFGTSAAASDSGSTAILPPGSVNASDVYPDKIRIVWEDRSQVNDGYRIRRTSATDFFEMTTTESVFTDLPSARPVTANTDYSYCIAAFANDPATADTFYSEEVCDLGRRPAPQDDGGGPAPIEPQVLTGGGAGHEFGRSVAVHSADSVNLAAIGSPGSPLPVAGRFGQAFLYSRSADGTWALDQELVLIDGAGVERRREYGFAVDVSADFAIVGDPQYSDNGDGRVSIFNLTAGTTQNYVAGDDPFIGSVDANNWGWAVALDGTAGLAGSPDGIAREQEGQNTGIALADCDVTTFNIPGPASDWLQHRPNVSLGSGAEFGYSLDVAGNYAIVGAPGEGSTNSTEGGGNAYIYLQTESPCGSRGTWDLQLTLFGFDISRAGERAGEAVAISDDFVLVGAPGAGNGGLVYAYRRSGGNWLPLGTLEANRTTTGFGKSIAIYQTANLVEALVGAPDESGGKGAVYAYRWDPVFEQWDGPTRYDASTAELTPADADAFGTSVAIGEGYYVVGAPGMDQPAADAGAVIVIPFDFVPVVLPSDLNPPSSVSATDGTSEDRIQLTWKDETNAEEGYRIYRSAAGGGLEVYDEVDVNVEVYNDVDAAAGAAYEYCVAAIDGDTESLRTCDIGWRPPNGVIGGRVAARSGGGTEDVTVCPDPNPNQALLFDGEGGFVQTTFQNRLRLDSFTILLWFRSSSGADQKILSSDTDLHPLEISGGKLRTCIDGCSIGSTNVNDGKWHHAAIVGDATNIRVYLDGLLEITHAPAGGQTQIMSGSLQLGKDADADASFLNGAIDEVQIWNVTRSVAQIDIDRSQSLSGNEDGLVAYWALDQGARNAAPDVTATAGHGLLRGGVYWTGESAPLDVCTTTDFEGNYELRGLRYGASGSFKVTPSLDQRSFDPGFATVTLSSESPVQNSVDFIDQTVFTISGLVTFEGGECPVPDVEMLVDGELRGTSELDGTYGVSASPSSDAADLRRVAPRLVNAQDAGDFHLFIPKDTVLFVRDDVPNINFVSTKTRTLSGFFGGSCGIDIGSATLRIYTENGCFERAISVQGTYSTELPPQTYLVEVVDVQTTNDDLRADIITFYDNLGAQVVDLTQADDTLDLIYHAPLSVQITGLEDKDNSSCTEPSFRFIAEDGQARDLPRVPLLEQPGDRIDPIVLTISAIEDFGGGLLCPVENATVTVFDEINDQDAGVELTTNINGVAVYLEDQPELPDGSPGPKAGDPYETYANTPSIFQGRSVDGVDRSLQKSLTAVVDVPNRESVTETAWAIVTGGLPRAGTFTTLPTTNIPLHILRDPPGDGSSSFLDKSSSVCNSISLSGSVNRSISQSVKVDAGLTFSAGFVSLYTDNKVKSTFGVDVALSAKTNVGGGWDFCARFDEKLSTSGSPLLIGPDADVFVGLGTNFIFALSDELAETNTCELELSEAFRVGLDPDNAFETVYTYSQAHIANTVVPQLQNLASLDPDNADDLLDAVDNWNSQLTFNRIEKHVAFGDCEHLEETEQERCNDLVSSRQLAIERLRDELIFDQEGACDERFQRAPDRDVCRQNVRDAAASIALPEPVNRSFDAGAVYSYSHERSSGRTFSVDVELELAQALSLKIEAEVGGSGPEFETKASLGIGGKLGWKRVRSDQHAVGYNLQDDDIGDSFTVDVVDDISFTTPIFRLRSGRSSNPWEAGTQPRDRAQIAINPPVIEDVPPDQPAAFTLSLTNAGDSKETREYILRTVHTANPGGAILSANGAPIHAGLSFFIGPDQTQEVTLAARRGPNRYQYEGLEVQLYPAGEYPIWADGGLNGNGIIQLADTARFDVFFDAPCSDIAILRPKENWSLNAATISDGLEIILNEFRLGVSETDSVESLGIEYRVSGDETPNRWPLEISVAADDLAADATSWSSLWQPDPALRNGLYEMRAFTECREGGPDARVYSDVITGTVDTKAPLVLGATEPADEILALGDDIAITFDEPIDCGSIDTDGVGENTTLTYVDGPDAGSQIPVSAVCDGRTVVIEPSDAFDWTQAENRLLRVNMLTGEVDGQGNPSVPSDLAGNPIGDPIAWQFTVKRSAFAWSPANLTINILADNVGLAADVVNGRAQEVAYTLADVPAWLSPSTMGGSLPPAGTETITFDVDASLLVANTLDTLAARTTDGDALLYLKALCELEDWTVEPSRFQYSMTVTGQLFVDGLVSDDSNDRVAAFVGNELRGVVNVSDISAGSNRVNLTVYSNNPSGETVTLRVFDASACHVFAGTDRTFTFVAGSGLGTPEQPVAINATDELEQQAISLAAGWTWFSLNREPGSAAVSDVLSTVLARSSDIVKSQTAFSVFDQGLGSWVGSLDSIEPGRTYLIKMANANTLVLGGPEVDPATSLVGVVPGWNWIGYLPQVSMTVDEALASLDATTDDLIKSQFQFAQFDGSNWVGSLTQMDPGLGYLLKASAAGSIQYPTASAKIVSTRTATPVVAPIAVASVSANVESRLAKDAGAERDEMEERLSGSGGRRVKPSLDAVPERSAGTLASWQLERDQFAHSMTVTAEVQIDGVPVVGQQHIVAAYVGHEIRGVARTRPTGSAEHDLVFLMVYSNEPEGEPVSFRLYDATNERYYDVNEELVFSADAIAGKPTEPHVLTVGAVATKAETTEELPTEFALRQNYPNPFNPVTTIRYELPKASWVEITLFDVLGRKVSTLLDDDRKAGRYDLVVDASGLASGMYVYRIKAGEFRDLRKMMVVK